MRLPSEGAAAFIAEGLFLLLQAAALIGIFAVVTYGFRAVGGRPRRGASLRYGLAFGLAGFILAAFVSSFIQGPWKPYLRNDVLFLGALLGGWRGAFVSFALSYAARLIYGGWPFWEVAFLDMASISLAGVVAHRYLRRYAFDRYGIWLIALVCAIRCGAPIISLAIVWGAGLMPFDILVSTIQRRLIASPLGVAVVAIILLLVRQDILDRRRAERIKEADRRDSLTGLPNRRALQEYVDAKSKAELGGVLAIIGLTNAARLSLDKDPDWLGEFWERAAEEIHDGALGPRFAQAAPSVFLFSDKALAIVLHGRSIDDDDLQHDLGVLRSTVMRGDRDTPLAEDLQLNVVAADLPAGSDIGADRFLRKIAQLIHRDDVPVTLCRHSLFEKSEQEARIREMIGSWIAGGRVPLQYQPKVSLTDARIVGAEALLRATDVDGGRLSPELVIDIAERFHLAGEFEWRTIQTGLRDGAGFAAAGLSLPISVNISAVSLTMQGFAARVADELHVTGVSPDRLILEMTEMQRVPDIPVVQDNVSKLRELGVGLSLDDYGAGWSALTMLARFHFSEIKVDRFLTSRLDQPRMLEAMNLAIESGRRYGAQLIVEGIETDEQRAILIQLGVLYGQGYLFSAATPVDDFLKRWLVPVSSAAS